MSVSPGRAGYIVARKWPPVTASVSAGCTATLTARRDGLPGRDEPVGAVGGRVQGEREVALRAELQVRDRDLPGRAGAVRRCERDAAGRPRPGPAGELERVAGNRGRAARPACAGGRGSSSSAGPCRPCTWSPVSVDVPPDDGDAEVEDALRRPVDRHRRREPTTPGEPERPGQAGRGIGLRRPSVVRVGAAGGVVAVDDRHQIGLAGRRAPGGLLGGRPPARAGREERGRDGVPVQTTRWAVAATAAVEAPPRARSGRTPGCGCRRRRRRGRTGCGSQTA